VYTYNYVYIIIYAYIHFVHMWLIGFAISLHNNIFEAYVFVWIFIYFSGFHHSNVCVSYICTNLYISVNLYKLFLTFIYIFINTSIHIYTYKCIHIDRYLNIDIYVYICTCICVKLPMYIHICIYLCVYIYTYTCWKIIVYEK